VRPADFLRQRAPAQSHADRRAFQEAADRLDALETGDPALQGRETRYRLYSTHRALRDEAELLVTALLDLLPVEGSWTTGYKPESAISPVVTATTEEWATAAWHLACVHALLEGLSEPEPALCVDERPERSVTAGALAKAASDVGIDGPALPDAEAQRAAGGYPADANLARAPVDGPPLVLYEVRYTLGPPMVGTLRRALVWAEDANGATDRVKARTGDRTMVHGSQRARVAKLCDRPPAGWWCNLERGHRGPCPTREIGEDWLGA
jgi:hypothetical protein